MPYPGARFAPLLLLTVCAFAQPAPRPAAPKSDLDRAIDEFKVQTKALGMRGESGRRRSGGGSGAAWHGRVFENLRNDFLDAVPHEVVQNNGTKSLLRRNQFGFNVTGPVFIPKLYPPRRGTFFSISYEGVRERISRSYLRTIATAAERTGDFSQTVDSAGNPLPVYDPDTTRPNPYFDASLPVSLDNLQFIRTPFPGNRIPEHRLSRVARNVLDYYPLPNTNIGPFFRNNYFSLSPETNAANGMILKVDHSVAERHRISAGYNFSNGFAGAARYFDTIADPGPPDREFSSRRRSLEHVFTISSHTVNTASFEANTDVSESTSPSSGGRLGLPGSDGAFPVIRYEGYLGVGRVNPFARSARNTFILTNGWSSRKGAHNLRLSAQYIKYQINYFGSSYPAGNFNFSSGLTSLPGIVNTGHGFASFLLGLSDYAEATYVLSPSYFRRASGAFSVRDTYEVRPGLTLSGGLNLDITTPRVEKYNRQSTVDLTVINPENGRPGALISATPDRRAFQPVRARLEPSAGIAWNPGGNPKFTIRASYSRNYNAIPVYSAQWGTQGFSGQPTYISPNYQLAPALILDGGVPPPPPLPDLRPDAANHTVADLMDQTDNQPVQQFASFRIERELPWAVALSTGWSFSGGKNMLVGTGAFNPNAIHLDALRYRDLLNDEAFNRSLRPYPQFKGFDLYSSWPAGSYRRDDLYARFDKRTSTGLSVSASYEFSKQLDDYSGPWGRQDFFNSRNEWSLSAWNNPHRLSLTYMYELPMGPNRPFLAYSDWRRHLIQGWSISGMTSFVSGEPLALRPQFNNTGGVVQSLRVNVVPGVDPEVEDPGPKRWFNPEAFSHPDDFEIGNGPRTHPTLRGPIAQNHDLSVTKRFALPADRALELSAVGFNFLNHANWTDPDVVIGPESAPNVNAGRITGSRGGRVVQVGMRLSF